MLLAGGNVVSGGSFEAGVLLGVKGKDLSGDKMEDAVVVASDVLWQLDVVLRAGEGVRLISSGSSTSSGILLLGVAISKELDFVRGLSLVLSAGVRFSSVSKASAGLAESEAFIRFMSSGHL